MEREALAAPITGLGEVEHASDTSLALIEEQARYPSGRISIVDAWSVSPRISRPRSLCASSRVTSTPGRASRRADSRLVLVGKK